MRGSWRSVISGAGEAAGTLLARLNPEALVLEEADFRQQLARNELEAEGSIFKLRRELEELDYIAGLDARQRPFVEQRAKVKADARARDLLERKIAAIEEQTRIANGKLRLAYERTLAFRELRMPYDGVVQYHIPLPEKEGMRVPVASATPILTVADDSSLYIAVALTDPELAKLRAERFSVSLVQGDSHIRACYAFRRIEKQGQNEQPVYYFAVPPESREEAWALVGANIVAGLHYRGGEGWRYESKYDLVREEGARSYLFRDAFVLAKADNDPYTLVEYPLSLTAPFAGACPLRLLPARPCGAELPVDVEIDGHKLPATTLPENKAAFLRHVYPGGAVFIPPDAMPQTWAGGYIRRHVVQVGEVSVQSLTRWEKLLRLLSQLDQTNSNVLSGAGMMDSRQQLEGSQQRFRLGATLGISVIICFLLTSIFTLEYRQNEYVYALIGSFGISRALLLGTFVAENTVLTALGFCAALVALQGVLPYITHVLYRSPQTLLELAELREDITLFCLAFLVCIAVSGLPILAAARKPIGNVLK